MFQEVLSANKHRVYPFYEDSNLGNLPEWMLLDIRFVNSTYLGDDHGSRLVCSKFKKEGERVTLFFEYSNSGETKEMTIPVDLGSDIVVGIKRPDLTSACKFAVYGGGSEYSMDLSDGEYSVGATVLASRTIDIGINRKLGSIGGATGVIHVVDGYNTTARIAGNTLNIDVSDGIGLGEPCYDDDSDDDTEEFSCNNALLFINGQHADSNGNINIAGGPGIVVQTGRTALVHGSVIPAITIRCSESIEEIL
jgi:hypothetical protein